MKYIVKRFEGRSNLVKTLDNTAWPLFDRFLRMGLGLFLRVWLARYLEPQKIRLLSFQWPLLVYLA